MAALAQQTTPAIAQTTVADYSWIVAVLLEQVIASHRVSGPSQVRFSTE